MYKMILALSFVGLAFQAHAASFLVDSAGRTVYTYDKDQGSTSVCYDACERAWPVVTSMPTSGGEFGTTVRKNGTVQITYDGKPLYYYVGDENPGDANGDGLGGIWHVVKDE